MILTLMLIILTATLVIVIIGFVMDRVAVTKLKSGMRTLNKRIKRLERVKLEGCYVEMDTETQEENTSTLPDNTDGDI